MKHVFLDHSVITDLVARKVIETRGLDPADVVLLTNRGFRSVMEHRAIEIQYSHSPESFPTERSRWRARRRLKALDRDVSRWTQRQPFHFYTPQTGQRFMQLIASHGACDGFSYLEEGLASYITREEMDRMFPPPELTKDDVRCYGDRIQRPYFFAEGHAHAYGIHERSFPGFSGRIVLPDVFADGSCDVEGDVTCVLVIGSSTRYGTYSLDSELAGLARAFDDLAARGIQRIHYKFHPAILPTAAPGLLRDLFARQQDRFAFIELGPDVQLETLASRSPNTRFVVSLSSVSVYAANYGNEVLSYAPYLVEREPALADTLALYPRIFFESVQMLAPMPNGNPEG